MTYIEYKPSFISEQIGKKVPSLLENRQIKNFEREGIRTFEEEDLSNAIEILVSILQKTNHKNPRIILLDFLDDAYMKDIEANFDSLKEVFIDTPLIFVDTTPNRLKQNNRGKYITNSCEFFRYLRVDVMEQTPRLRRTKELDKTIAIPKSLFFVSPCSIYWYSEETFRVIEFIPNQNKNALADLIR